MKRRVQQLQRDKTTELNARLAEAGKVVADEERKRFAARRAELTRALDENRLEKLDERQREARG